MSFEALRGALRSGAAAMVPFSASPLRADPRPPTCRSIGIDLAASLREVAGDDPDVQKSCLEAMREELPTVAWPQMREDKVAAQLLSSLRDYVDGPLALPGHSEGGGGGGGGTRQKEAQQALHTLAAAVHSAEVTKERNVATALLLTGLSRTMWKNGGDLRESNMATSSAGASSGGVSLGAGRLVRSDAVDLDFMYDWFHTESPDVEPDKTVKWAYKKKKVTCAGKERMITCRPKILTWPAAITTAGRHR